MGHRVFQIVDADAEPLDIDCKTRLRIRFNHDRVETGIAGGGLEFRGERGQKLAERRLDFDPDD